MQKTILFFAFLCSIKSFGQPSDTTFSIRGNSCNCIFREEGEERKIFNKAQQAPSFPGGVKDWKEFVKTNISSQFSGKKEEFTVGFVVNPEVNISDIRMKTFISDIKFQEAKRLLLLSGKWCPGMQNVRCVRAWHQVDFKF